MCLRRERRRTAGPRERTMTAKRRARPRSRAKPAAAAASRRAAPEGRGRLAAIEHIVVVTMENRSFDHMLGYLSLPPWNAARPPVDGVSLDPAWLQRFTNFLDGRSFPPHAFTDRRIDDPPHTRPSIAIQLGTSAGAAGPSPRMQRSGQRASSSSTTTSTVGSSITSSHLGSRHRRPGRTIPSRRSGCGSPALSSRLSSRPVASRTGSSTTPLSCSS
jgi:hypothetical protein